MYLIQILLPLRDPDGKVFKKPLFDEVRTDLADHFGGVTAYTRTAASSLWADASELLHDDVVIFEVMTDRLEREFWRLYRHELQDVFRREKLVMRAQRIELL